MKMQKGTRLYIVADDGLSKMTFEGFNNALNGGTSMEDVEVFTELEEAQKAERARKRRLLIRQFDKHDVLAATYRALLDNSGEVICKIEFCPTD